MGRGIRQGCSLSGMLYSLAIVPFLQKLRQTLQGMKFPGCPAVKECANVDDVMVFLDRQEDIDILSHIVQQFGQIYSAKIS